MPIFILLLALFISWPLALVLLVLWVIVAVIKGTR